MGILLCEQNFRDVWIRNKSFRAEIGQILRTHTQTHTHTTAAKLVVRMCSIHVCMFLTQCHEFPFPATRGHLPRGATFAPNRRWPLVAGTTVLLSQCTNLCILHPLLQCININRHIYKGNESDISLMDT